MPSEKLKANASPLIRNQPAVKNPKLKFVITAGGTREYIDPVRFISNASSGQMGYALADAAKKAGADVTLITAPTHLKAPDVKVVHVETSGEMFGAVKDAYKSCDCLIMAAAVSDFAPAVVSKTKIKKSDQPLVIELKPTTDILKWTGENKQGQFLVGFALEDRDIIGRAYKKLQAKNLDMIVANSPAAIGAKKSSVYIISIKNTVELEETPKPALAKKIISGILKNLAESK
jgi:phosphopantothenoylcysteine synthetase/decarboxylase